MNEKFTINIPSHVAVHEAGHLVIGLLLGIQEQGILFSGGKDEAAQAWFSVNDHGKALRRSLAGLLAHLIVLPDALEPRLRDAYEHSIIFTEDLPHRKQLAPEEIEFLSGAWSDMALAHAYAAKMNPTSSADALQSVQEAEKQVRELLVKHASVVARVAADIQSWAKEPERHEERMPLYPHTRAEKLLGQSPSFLRLRAKP